MLEVVLGFAEHQEKGTFGLGYLPKLTITRNCDNAVLNKDNCLTINKTGVIFNSIG